MRYFKFIIVLFISIIIFYACKKETGDPVDMGHKYFPVNTGHWVVYDVDSISYNDFTGEIDSFNYQIKEIVESVFTDNSGRESQRLERYIRHSDTDEWSLKNVWYETRTMSGAERVEENLRLVKLIFPPEESQEWNGNIYNTLDAQTYKFQNVHDPYTINNTTFDSTLTVLQRSQLTLISDNFQQEIYAANIGMVYKKYVSLVKKPTGEITSGIDYSYTFVSYGN